VAGRVVIAEEILQAYVDAVPALCVILQETVEDRVEQWRLRACRAIGC